MKISFFKTAIVALTLLISSWSVFAADDVLIPHITAPGQIPLATQTVFSASDSQLLPDNPSVSYAWDFGNDSQIRWGETVIHQFTQPGRYTVSLSIKQGAQKETVTKDIFVYAKQGVLISDDAEHVSSIFKQAGEKGLFLKIIPYYPSQTDLLAEEIFLKSLNEFAPYLTDADIVLIDTANGQAFQDLVRWWQGLSDESRFDPIEKTWVQISSGSLSRMMVRLHPQFTILQPKNILLTRLEAINPILEEPNIERAIRVLGERAIEYQILDDTRRIPRWKVFSQMIQFFVANGISQNVLYWLLAVPFLAFIVSFFRQFIGVSTLGVYAPVMIALSWMVMGLRFGALAFLVILIVNYVVRWLFTKIDLLYVPKVSMTLSVLSLSFFLVLAIGIAIDSSLNLSLTIFPMLMMSTLSEKFLSAQSDAGLKKALLATIETVIVAAVGYGLVQWGAVKDLIITSPEVVILPLIGIIWLGKFTGLRLSEYFKFRSLMTEDENE